MSGMNKELLDQAKSIWDRQTRASRFATRFGVYPIAEGRELVDAFHELSEAIPGVSRPAGMEEVYQAELKRRALSEAVSLDHGLSGKPYTFDDVINIYGIERADIIQLKPWLETNKKAVLDAINRVFQGTDVKQFELTLPMDRPIVRRQAEEFAQQRVSTYHKRIGKMFEELTGVGGYLRDINALVTTEGRSYFDTLTKTLAISIPAVCYLTQDGLPTLKERDLIRLFGHEGFGHGCNKILTDTADGLPFFLKETSGATVGTLESVAQFYEQQVFEDLKNSPETQDALGIRHLFEDIYREEQDTQIIERYKLRFFQYGITVLADQSFGLSQDPETIAKKSEVLSAVALYPGHARHFIEGNRQNFDSLGNLNPELVAELRYAAQPVQRVMEILGKRGISYEGNGRTQVDIALLQGFWTPVGLVERAGVI